MIPITSLILFRVLEIILFGSGTAACAGNGLDPIARTIAGSAARLWALRQRSPPNRLIALVEQRHAERQQDLVDDRLVLLGHGLSARFHSWSERRPPIVMP